MGFEEVLLFFVFTKWVIEFKLILARVLIIVWYSIDFASFGGTKRLCSVGMTRFSRAEHPCDHLNNTFVCGVVVWRKTDN